MGRNPLNLSQIVKGKAIPQKTEPVKKGPSGSTSAKKGLSVRIEGIKRHVRELRSEIKKVAWPTRRETINLTMVVIAISVIVGLFLGGADLLFSSFYKLVSGG